MIKHIRNTTKMVTHGGISHSLGVKCKFCDKVKKNFKLAPCYQCGGDSTKCDCEEKLLEKKRVAMLDNNICPECGEQLPDPVWENREGGYSESVIYCSCGATYTN
jgi:hypothetical protein